VIQKTTLFFQFSYSAINNISISVPTSGMEAILVVFGVGTCLVIGVQKLCNFC